ncbi:MAG: thioredoxin family protein, partial [Bacteroidia bacterium]
MKKSTLQMMNNPYTYIKYRDLVYSLADKGKTTGEETKEKIEYTKLNAQRMHRIEKQVVLNDELKTLLKGVKKNWIWLVLAESWCGDAAQNLPIINKMAEASTHIEMKVILRDENLEIMDAHLTNGNRSVPILICVDIETGKEIGTWGSRPKAIQDAANE